MFLPHSRSHFASLAKREGKWKKENPIQIFLSYCWLFFGGKGRQEPPAGGGNETD